MSSLTQYEINQNWPELRVRTMCIDEFSGVNVGFIKVDAEGHELEILNGATLVLQRDKPSLVVEVEERNREGSIDRVVTLMRNFGYEAYFVKRNRVYPFNDFQMERDQNPALFLGGKRCSYRDYINNFIFIHPARSLHLPTKVPSGFRALMGTVAGSVGGLFS